MITQTSLVMILVGAGLSLLLAYGKTRWFGKQFHPKIYAASALNYFSFMLLFYLLAQQTTAIWRPCLMVAAALAWVFATRWMERIEQAQEEIPEGRIVAKEKQH